MLLDNIIHVVLVAVLYTICRRYNVLIYQQIKYTKSKSFRDLT